MNRTRDEPIVRDADSNNYTIQFHTKTKLDRYLVEWLTFKESYTPTEGVVLKSVKQEGPYYILSIGIPNE